MKDSKYMTAREKELVLRDWERFLKSNLSETAFTDRLYKHLTLNCSFIAYYNKNSFYSTYFIPGDQRAKFLRQFIIGVSVEYGTIWWLEDEDYGDINNTMIQVGKKYIPKLYKEAQEQQYNDDIALARKLLAKHGIELKI